MVISFQSFRAIFETFRRVTPNAFAVFGSVSSLKRSEAVPDQT